MDEAIKNLRNFISNWNEKDDQFIFEGSIYTEDDVHKAEEALEILTQ